MAQDKVARIQATNMAIATDKPSSSSVSVGIASGTIAPVGKSTSSRNMPVRNPPSPEVALNENVKAETNVASCR